MYNMIKKKLCLFMNWKA